MSTEPELVGALWAEPSARRRPGCVVVDLERIGKRERQARAGALLGDDTTIRPDDADAVRRLRDAGVERVVCRINPVGDQTAGEIDTACMQGAASVIVPMWRSRSELETVLDLARGRVGVGVMVETVPAVQDVRVLQDLDIEFAFVGLVDLAIDRGTRSIFAPLVDGTIEQIAEGLGEVPFGFGGLTLPSLGSPIPNALLVGEMLRVGASFSFMRRSFLNDLGDTDPGSAIEAIRDAAERLARRSATQVAADHADLVARVTRLVHARSA